jgi:hypothetical protein
MASQQTQKPSVSKEYAAYVPYNDSASSTQSHDLIESRIASLRIIRRISSSSSLSEISASILVVIRRRKIHLKIRGREDLGNHLGD